MYSIKKLFALFAMLAIALSLCNAASVYPKSLTTQSGSASTSNVNSLKTKDLTGTEDKWNDYVEFYGTDSAYTGVFTFDVSNVASACYYDLNVNYRGPNVTEQVWQWEIQNQATGAWTLVGNNAIVSSWIWTDISLQGVDDFTDIVKDGEVQVRFSSTTAFDNCDVDFLQLSITTPQSGPAPTEPASEPTEPAAQPTEPASEPTEPAAEPTSAPTEPEPSTAPTDRANTHGPTHAPTQRATERPTQHPTQRATERPTQHPTSAPTTRPTSKPTTAPSKPTSKPTSAPTTRPTSKPTTAPTSKPTTAPTSKPTTPTSKPTSAPSQPTNGRVCAAGTHYRPGPGTTWQWQLSGTIDTSVVAQMYDIDMFDSSASLIQSLHTLGRAVTCYIDTAYEPGRPDSSQFTAAVLGNGIDGWPGQKWVDIRSTVVRNIMANRITQAASKGCDALEMDDVDSYTNNPGFPLTAADQLDFNNFLATTAHANGLGIGLKNDLDQVASLSPNFDFAINEQCYEYDECSSLNTFITQGKAVFGVEYDLQTSQFCSQANAAHFSWLKKDLDLDASVTQCCPTCSGTFTCVSNTATRSVQFEEDEPALVEAAEEPVVAEEKQVAYDSAAPVSGVAFIAVIAVFAALL